MEDPIRNSVFRARVCGGHDILISFRQNIAYTTCETRSQLFDMKGVNWRLSNHDSDNDASGASDSAGVSSRKHTSRSVVRRRACRLRLDRDMLGYVLTSFCLCTAYANMHAVIVVAHAMA